MNAPTPPSLFPDRKTPSEVDQLRANILALLNRIGEKAACRGCQRDIWWVMHRSGHRAPYTAEGLNHFADCPAADTFRSNRR